MSEWREGLKASAEWREGLKASAPGFFDAPKMSEARARAVADRGVCSGAIPYGYRRGPRDPADRHQAPLEVEPAEAEVVRLIFRLYIGPRVRDDGSIGGSLVRVAMELSNRGLMTRSGCAWSRAGLAWILSNEVYLGVARYAAARKHAAHEPIVAPIVFRKAGKRLRLQRKRGRGA